MQIQRTVETQPPRGGLRLPQRLHPDDRVGPRHRLHRAGRRATAGSARSTTTSRSSTATAPSCATPWSSTAPSRVRAARARTRPSPRPTPWRSTPVGTGSRVTYTADFTFKGVAKLVDAVPRQRLQEARRRGRGRAARGARQALTRPVSTALALRRPARPALHRTTTAGRCCWSSRAPCWPGAASTAPRRTWCSRRCATARAELGDRVDLRPHRRRVRRGRPRARRRRGRSRSSTPRRTPRWGWWTGWPTSST